jgi:hypothetical protein
MLISDNNNLPILDLSHVHLANDETRQWLTFGNAGYFITTNTIVTFADISPCFTLTCINKH